MSSLDCSRPMESRESSLEQDRSALEYKEAGNEHFRCRRFPNAAVAWEQGVTICPPGYDLAVLQANLAAAHLHLREWSQANEAATASLAELDRLPNADQAQQTQLRTKALLRRAKARECLGGWADLQGAEEDYRLLTDIELLPKDRHTVQQALRILPPRIKAAQESEMGEMVGKLKDLGNGLLRPFGLSTDMFNVNKTAGGGYSMSMGDGGGR